MARETGEGQWRGSGFTRKDQPDGQLVSQSYTTSSSCSTASAGSHTTTDNFKYFGIGSCSSCGPCVELTGRLFDGQCEWRSGMKAPLIVNLHSGLRGSGGRAHSSSAIRAVAKLPAKGNCEMWPTYVHEEANMLCCSSRKIASDV